MQQRDAERFELAVGEPFECCGDARRWNVLRLVDQRRDDERLATFVEAFADEVPPLRLLVRFDEIGVDRLPPSRR